MYLANVNSTHTVGYKSVSFMGIWSFFLAAFFLFLGAFIVFRGKASEIANGFMIGTSFMLCQLFFMLAVIALGVGTEAANRAYGSFLDTFASLSSCSCFSVTANGDKAYGVFTLLLSIIYFVWAVILSVHRKAVTTTRQEAEIQYAAKYSNNDTGEVRNPAAPSESTSVAVDDEAEL